MPAKVNPPPDAHRGVTPYLIVSNAAEAIEFYKQVFGATEVMRMAAPGGRVGHAELALAGGCIMLADEHPQMGARSPQSIGGTPVTFLLYVADVDAVVQRALAAGATVLKPVQDQFYGDRSGTLKDPCGHQWTIATHKEDVSPEEIQRRAQALFGPKQ